MGAGTRYVMRIYWKKLLESVWKGHKLRVTSACHGENFVSLNMKDGSFRQKHLIEHCLTHRPHKAEWYT